MQALRLYGPRDMRTVDEPVPVPRADEALLRVSTVSVCHSDIHYYLHGRIGDTVSTVPLVLGHEFSAEVVDVAPGVTRVRPGDRVAVEPAISCGHCRYCLEGNPNFCQNILFCGTPPTDGALREYMTFGQEFLFPLPSEIDDEEGALLEPMGVALHAWNLGKHQLGASVAVVGCGPIGLILVQMAKMAGASQVIAIEPLAYRREAAEAWGAVALAPGPDLEQQVRDMTHGYGVDLAIEVAGAVPAQEEAARVVKHGGTVVLIGIPPEDQVLLPHHVARRKGLTIKMARRMKLTYPKAIEMMQQGMVDLKSLVTHRYGLSAGSEAYQLVADYADGVIKAMIAP